MSPQAQPLAAVPPPPPGFAPELQGSAIPPPPAGFTPEAAAAPKQYAPGREFGANVARGMGLDADKIKAAEDSGGSEAALKELGSQVWEGLAGFAHKVVRDPAHLMDPINSGASALTDALGLPDTASVFDPKNYKTPSIGKTVGALSTILGGAEGAKDVAAVAGAPGAAKTFLGTVKPTVVSELDKTHSLAGRAAKVLAENVLPDTPEYTAAVKRAAEEKEAIDIDRANKIQDAYQAKQQRAQAAAAKVAAKAQADAEAAQAEAGKPVPITQSPYYATNKAAQAAAAKAQADAAAAEEAARKPVPITQSPNYDAAGFRAGTAQRTTTPTPITTPKTGKLADMAASSEGRPATWTNDTVKRLAAWGDPDAIEQAQLRGFGTIPKKYSSVDLNPKSVTKFDAEGNPITEGEPNYIYRTRDVGESGIPADQRANAHATSSLDQARQFAQSRGDVTGKPQEVIRYDLNRAKPGDVTKAPFSKDIDWYKLHKPVPESHVEVVPPVEAQVE